MTNRSHWPWVDRCKGLLILLVVLGHIVGTAGHCDSEPSRTLQFVFKVIYSFHMPAFFLMAGVTWRPAGAGTVREFAAFVGKKAQRLLVPYLVFGLGSIAAYLMFSGAAYDSYRTGDDYYLAKGGMSFVCCLKTFLCASGWPNGQGLEYNSVLWFLPSLFTLEVIYWAVDRFSPQRIVQLGVGVAAVALGWVVLHHELFYLPWGLGRLPMNLFYFLIGRWFVPLEDLSPARRLRRVFPGVGLAIAAMLMGAVCWNVPDSWMCAYKIKWHLVYVGIAVCGGLMSVGVGRLVDSKLLVLLGGSSMGIMLTHKFVVVAGFKIPLVRGLCAGTLAEKALCVVVLTVLAVSLSTAVTRILKRWLPWTIGERWLYLKN